MATLATFIPIALSVALFVAVFKIHKLSSALELQQADSAELMRDLEQAGERSVMLEKRLKKESENRGDAELKLRECSRTNNQNKNLAADTSSQLQYKIQENFGLTKQLEDVKQQLEVKKKEAAKAGEEAIRYRDLFEAGNARLNDVREAYQKLQQQVDVRVAKPSGKKLDGLQGGHLGTIGESVVRREATAGEEAHTETGKAQEEQNQVESTADNKKPSSQEPTQQQQQKQEEEKKKEATQEAERKEEAGGAKAEVGKKEGGGAKVEEEGKDGEQEKDEREMTAAKEDRKVQEDEEEEEGEGENKRERARRSVMMKMKELKNRKAA